MKRTRRASLKKIDFPPRTGARLLNKIDQKLRNLRVQAIELLVLRLGHHNPQDPSVLEQAFKGNLDIRAWGTVLARKESPTLCARRCGNSIPSGRCEFCLDLEVLHAPETGFPARRQAWR